MHLSFKRFLHFLKTVFQLAAGSLQQKKKREEKATIEKR